MILAAAANSQLQKNVICLALPQTQSNQGPCPTGVEMVQIHSPKWRIPLQQPQDSYLNPGVEPNQAAGTSINTQTLNLLLPYTI